MRIWTAREIMHNVRMAQSKCDAYFDTPKADERFVAVEDLEAYFLAEKKRLVLRRESYITFAEQASLDGSILTMRKLLDKLEAALK